LGEEEEDDDMETDEDRTYKPPQKASKSAREASLRASSFHRPSNSTQNTNEV
jgi:hypothetical protein